MTNLATEPMGMPQQKARALLGLIGFGGGSLVGLYFFNSMFPSCIVGLAIGALVGHYFWHHFIRTKV